MPIPTVVAGLSLLRMQHRLPAVILLVMLPVIISCDTADRHAGNPQADRQPRDFGYSVLRMLLRDEKHLRTLHLVKKVLTFQNASDSTKDLIGDIARISSAALDDMDRLATLQPAIRLDDPDPDQLGGDVLEALRKTTAIELIRASGDEFELYLILSQTQALRLIVHLARELMAIEPNGKRRSWLEQLAGRYDDLYQRALARLALARAAPWLELPVEKNDRHTQCTVRCNPLHAAVT